MTSKEFPANRDRNRSNSQIVIPRELLPALQLTPNLDPEIDDEQSDNALRRRLWALRRHWWSILAFVALCTVAAALLSRRITPVYEATATIDVDRRAPNGVVGQDALTSSSSDTEQFLSTQVRLIQSDSVLKPVAQSFGLTKPSGSNGFPNLRIIRPANTFLLLINYRSPDKQMAADFANRVARSYIEQTYNIRYRASVGLATFMNHQIEGLRKNMLQSGEALAKFERELNMIGPEEANGIVSARLLQLNAEYTTAQGDRVKKEAAYQSLQGGKLESAEVSTQGEPLRRLVERLTEAKDRFNDLSRVLDDRHPEYIKAQERVASLTSQLESAKTKVSERSDSEYREALNREAILRRHVDDTKAEFDRLNARSFQYQNLRREAEADRKLYEELANRIKEAEINAGFQNSAIRLADPAEPSEVPVYPNVPSNIALALFLSLAFAVSVALIADALDGTLRNKEDIERALGTQVIGLLPQVKNWEGGWLMSPQSPDNRRVPGLIQRSDDGVAIKLYEDAVLSMRNAILLGTSGHSLKSILISSTSPAEGKTTLAANLAIANVLQKRKTLLIDCDLRRPGLHRTFNLSNSVGMSYALEEESDWREQISRSSDIPNLDILLAGNASRQYANLVGRYLPRILKEGAEEYDLIIVDSPPLLGFPEPLQMAASVDGVILVTKAGKTSRQAVSTAISTLSRLHANILGIALNEVTRNTTKEYGFALYNSSRYAAEIPT